MPNDAGVASWSPPFLFDHPWLSGAFLATSSFGIEKLPEAPSVAFLTTLAGTVIVQGQIVGNKAPEVIERHGWRLDISPISNLDDYLALERARAKGQPVDFGIGGRVIDVFAGSVAGDTKTLSRRIALGVVAGVTDAEYPTRVFLDGEEDSGAATVSGQTVTVVSGGEISVEYTPVYKVFVANLPWAIPTHNKMDVTFLAQETTTGDFGIPESPLEF